MCRWGSLITWMPNRFRLPWHESNWGQQICDVGENERTVERTYGCGVEPIKSLVNRMKSFSNAQCKFCNLLQWTFCNGYSRGIWGLIYLELNCNWSKGSSISGGSFHTIMRAVEPDPVNMWWANQGAPCVSRHFADGFNGHLKVRLKEHLQGTASKH